MPAALRPLQACLYSAPRKQEQQPVASDKPALGPACTLAAGTADGPRVAQAGVSVPALDGRNMLCVPGRRTSTKEEPLSPVSTTEIKYQTQKAEGSAEGAHAPEAGRLLCGVRGPREILEWGLGGQE